MNEWNNPIFNEFVENIRMDPDHDILRDYVEILSKTKKKFGFKKPNHQEISEELDRLAKILKSQDCKPYAGLVLQSKANSEAALGDTQAQVDTLLEAAEMFFATEQDTADLRCVSIQSYLASGLHCFKTAIGIKVKEEDFLTALYLSQRLARKLRSFSHYHDALVTLKYALTLIPEELSELIPVRQDIINISIVVKAYQQAVRYSKEIRIFGRKLPGTYSDLVRENELSYMMLVLLVHVKKGKYEAELNELIAEFNPCDVLAEKKVAFVDKYLYFHMQGMLMSYMLDNLPGIQELGDVFHDYLTPHQAQLFHLLVTKNDKRVDLY